MTARRPDAELIAVLGARGSGKSQFTKRWLAKSKPKRLGVWDTKREYQLDATSNIAEFIRTLKGRTWRIAFHPTIGDPERLAKEFDLYCRAMYAAKHCTAVPEELAFVTRPSSAPPGWRTLLLLGRDENPEGGCVTVVTTAQRPASIDKDLLGNCTLIHAGRLPYEDDARLVGKSLGVPPTELQHLAPLHWIERGVDDNAPRRGVLKISGTAAAPPRAPSGSDPKARNSTPE